MLSFKEKMGAQFGSDEAIGLTFVLDELSASGERTVLSIAEYEALLAKVGLENMPDMCSELPNGGSGTCCTDYARLIRETLKQEHVVQVVGFANEDNPTSRVAREQIHPGGHDFAWVDGRYIVDPWLTLVACDGKQFVFDTQNPYDAALIADIYGPYHCWQDLDTDQPVQAPVRQEALA